MAKTILFDIVFVKHYKKRVLPQTKLHRQYKKMLRFFLENPYHPQLKNHKLKGKMKEFRAFFVDDNCRVIYTVVNNTILFLDIGKHEEVYK